MPAGEQFVQLVEQPGPDHPRVWRVDGHPHGDRFGGVGHLMASAPGVTGCWVCCAASRRETMWRTTAPGLRRLVLTRMVATRRYNGVRLAISARNFSARSGPASNGRTVLPPLRRTPSLALISR